MPASLFVAWAGVRVATPGIAIIPAAEIAAAETLSVSADLREITAETELHAPAGGNRGNQNHPGSVTEISKENQNSNPGNRGNREKWSYTGKLDADDSSAWQALFALHLGYRHSPALTPRQSVGAGATARAAIRQSLY